MGDKSNIEWTDATWNPTTGCTPVSPGCAKCYAIGVAARMERMQPGLKAYQGLTVVQSNGVVGWTGEVRCNSDRLGIPHRWTKARRIFVDSMSDLFHDAVPNVFIDEVFAIMQACPRHTFQILTKRPQNAARYLNAPERRASIDAAMLRVMESGHLNGVSGIQRLDQPEDEYAPKSWPLPNVWMGTSVENQAVADERIIPLTQCPAAKRFLSIEPLLGPIDLHPLADNSYRILSSWYGPDGFDPSGTQPVRERMTHLFPKVDQVIVGGESGKGARPMHPQWVRDLRDQCALNTAFFFKQWGEYFPVYDRDVDDPDWKHADAIAKNNPNGQWLNLAGGQGFHGERVVYVERKGKHRAGRLLDGREWSEFPDAD